MWATWSLVERELSATGDVKKQEGRMVMQSSHRRGRSHFGVSHNDSECVGEMGYAIGGGSKDSETQIKFECLTQTSEKQESQYSTRPRYNALHNNEPYDIMNSVPLSHPCGSLLLKQIPGYNEQTVCIPRG